MRPDVEDLGKRGGLPAPEGGFVLRTNTSATSRSAQKSATFSVTTSRPAALAVGRGDLCVVSRPEADLGHVDGAVIVGVARSRRRLIDQEGGHASSGSRCRARCYGFAPPVPGCGRSAPGSQLGDQRHGPG